MEVVVCCQMQESLHLNCGHLCCSKRGNPLARAEHLFKAGLAHFAFGLLIHESWDCGRGNLWLRFRFLEIDINRKRQNSNRLTNS